MTKFTELISHLEVSDNMMTSDITTCMATVPQYTPPPLKKRKKKKKTNIVPGLYFCDWRQFEKLKEKKIQPFFSISGGENAFIREEEEIVREQLTEMPHLCLHRRANSHFSLIESI